MASRTSLSRIYTWRLPDPESMASRTSLSRIYTWRLPDPESMASRTSLLRNWSDLYVPAGVDRHVVAGDVPGAGRDQERDRLGHVRLVDEPAERGLRGEVRVHL